jgi:hypothetical protein
MALAAVDETLERLGIAVPAFGDSTGGLAGLES